MSIPLLLVTGPIGAGKTSVVAEIAELLDARRIPHAALDMDWLSSYFPRPPADPFGTVVGLQNLAAIWPNFAAAGARRLVLAGVVLSRENLDPYLAAVPGAEIAVCRLHAPVHVLQARVREREIGSALTWHLARAAELAGQFERSSVADIVVDNGDRTVREVALEVLSRIGWIEPADSAAP